MKKILAFIVTLVFIFGNTNYLAQAAGNTIYVDTDNNSGNYDGASWATAYKRLQNGLDAASNGDQVWVAEGVYYPDEGTTQTNNDRNETFTLINGVAIYGGFAGTETQLSQRNPAVNITILSGDIDKNDTDPDTDGIIESVADLVGSNSYHVVTGSGTNNTAVLDGFTITAGKGNYLGAITDANALGAGIYNISGSPVISNLYFIGNYNAFGGGMYNQNGALTLSNVTFTANAAYEQGGGIYNNTSSPSLVNVTFANNIGYTGGGGMYNKGGAPTLFTVTFSGNVAEDPTPGSTSNGGGMVNNDSSPSLQNTVFNGNLTDGYGGGLYNYGNSDPIITNITFNGNTASLGGGMANMPSLSFGYSDPTLENATFSNNIADYGGGIYASNSNTELTMGLFKGNYAYYEGAGIYLTTYSDFILTNITFGGLNQALNYGAGLAIKSFSNPTLTNLTFSENAAGNYNSLYIVNNSHPTIKNLVMSGNSITTGECYADGTSSLDPTSSHNLIDEALSVCGLANGVNGNIIGISANLGPLQNNGGSTETYALTTGSPAIDAGTNTGCPSLDQRGVSRPQGAGCDIGAYEYQAPSISVLVGGTVQGAYSIFPGHSQRLNYAGLNNGPVVVSGSTDILSSIRVLYKGKSYSEMLGFPTDQLTNEYWFPVYDSATLNSQLRIGNMGSEDTIITVYLGNGEELDSFSLGVDEAVRKNYSGENGGPLRVVSSTTNILVSMRLLYGDSYTEELGYPADQLTNDYWFPWYNNTAFPSELRVANTGDVEANVTVYIGDNVVLDTFSLGVGGSLRKFYPGTNNGPLRVVSSTSTVLPSIRVLYKGISYSEMLGLPNSKLTNEYWLPAYDSSTVNSQLRFGNVGGVDTIVTVYIAGGQILDTFTLDAGDAVRKNYAGVDDGPLHIVSSASEILVTNRILMTTTGFESYYELLAYPTASLASELWFPWYNNMAFPSQLRIAVP